MRQSPNVAHVWAMRGSPTPGTVGGCVSVTLIRGDVTEAIASAAGCTLVMADPPWRYTQAKVRGNAQDQYDGMAMPEIAAVLDLAFDAAADDSYLHCWATWPLLGEWMPHMASTRWRYLTGGSWHKTGGLGIGFHVRGDSEPWFLLSKGTPHPSRMDLSNAWASRRGGSAHSEKPQWHLRAAIEAWTQPGDLILSLWSGMCPEGRAAQMCGRSLVGAELDPSRHADAVDKMSQGVLF